MKQQTQRGKSKPAKKLAPAKAIAKSIAKAPKPIETVASLKQERELLLAKLEAAEKRIAELEANQLAAINRIDWVLDSLATVSEVGVAKKRTSAIGSGS